MNKTKLYSIMKFVSTDTDSYLGVDDNGLLITKNIENAMKFFKNEDFERLANSIPNELKKQLPGRYKIEIIDIGIIEEKTFESKK